MRSTLKRVFPLATVILLGTATIFAQAPPKVASAGFDLLIEGATIVTMDPARRVIEDGVIGVSGDTITFVGPSWDFHSRNAKGFMVKQTIDAKGKLIMPGLINGHTHVPMVLMRGLIDDVTLDDWLRRYIFPAEARNVTEDYVR
jgi:5-methylthioadenosine/S-adenosylhomocysteine deaminase